MKNLLPIISIFIISIFTVGCSDESSTKQGNPHVLGEHDLIVNKAYATEEDIVILNLESPTGQDNKDDVDLSIKGKDCYRLKMSKNYDNIKFEIEDSLAIESIRIQDTLNYDTTIFTKGDKNTFSFKANRAYDYCVTHDGSKETPERVFVRFLQEVDSNSTTMSRSRDDDVRKMIASGSCTGAGCDLSKVTFADFVDSKNTIFKDINLSGANLSNSYLKGPIDSFLNFDGANFSGANVNGATFEFISLENALMNDLEINGTAKFLPTYINKAKFARSNLSGKTAIFEEKIAYSNMDFSNANLSGVAMIQRTFDSSCNFNGANLSGAIMHDSNFNGINFTGAKLLEANMENSMFAGSNLKSANLYNASLAGANFSNANLMDSNLSGIKSSGTIFTGSALNGAIGLDGSNIEFRLQLSVADYQEAYKMNSIQDLTDYCVSKNAVNGGMENCANAASWSVKNVYGILVVQSNEMEISDMVTHKIRYGYPTGSWPSVTNHDSDRTFRSTVNSGGLSLHYYENNFFMDIYDSTVPGNQALFGAKYTTQSDIDHWFTAGGEYAISSDRGTFGRNSFNVIHLPFYLIAK